MLKVYFVLYNVIIIIIWNVSAARQNGKTIPFSDILKKFHQSDYKLTYEWSEHVRSDKQFLNYNIRPFKYNRTTTAVNATIDVNKNVGYDVEIIVQAFRFASNEYRMFPLHFQFNLCDAIKTQAIGYDKFSSTNGNFSCPILKGKHFRFYNWAPEESKLPPLIPTGKYMLELQFMYHSREILLTRDYGSVYRPFTK